MRETSKIGLFDEVKSHNVFANMNNSNTIGFLTKVTPNTVGVSIYSQREWGDRSQAAFDILKNNF